MTGNKYRELERICPEEAGISSSAVKNFVEKVQHDKTQMHGIMAMKDGRVFLEGWWEPYGREYPHSCHSMGKSYVCTAIGIACTQGLLSMETRIADLFAEEIKEWDIHQTDAFGRLQVRHVVTMTSGMEHMSELSDDWIYQYLKNPVVFEPGSRFLYNTAGSCLLAVIIRKVTGQDVSAYLSANLFSKIGIDPDTVIWLKFHDGNIAEPGCFSLTENNLRLGMLYVNEGMWDGEQIIDKQWIRDALSVHIDNSDWPGGKDSRCGYGYQLWKCAYPGAWRFDGGQGQFCIMLPEKKILVAINEGGVEPFGPGRTLEMIYRYLFDEIEEEPLERNEKDYKALCSYISSLRVAETPPNVYMPAEDCFSGTYRVTGGNATPWIGVSPNGFNFFESFYDPAKKKEMTDFTICADKEKVVLSVNGYADFYAWFDGEIRIHYTDSVLPQLDRTYSTARFLDDHTLEITINWIAGWFVTVMTFKREQDGSYSVCASKNILNEQRPFFTDRSRAVKYEINRKL
ncbi:MAG: beta-lactamase family protein [Acetatifactor sp.]|nr:beta-lactamase family protein [Acetatifactor sp.]